MARKLLVDVRASASAWRVTDEALAQLAQASAPGWVVHVATTDTSSDGDGGSAPAGEISREIVEAEIYFGFGIARDLFRSARRLRWVHSATAGIGAALFPEMRESAVLLTSSAGLYGPTIAEHVLAGILHFMRAFDLAIGAQRERRWIKGDLTNPASPMRELAGSRVLVVGVGGIGSAVARRLSLLGAHCVGVRRRVDLGVPPGFERVVALAALDSELPAADVVVLGAPGTGETMGLLGRKRIALLRQGAIVVNVARGLLLDEAALCAALDEGRVRGAFLDVMAGEPLAADSPLWQQRGVLITPHVSAVSPGTFWKREMSLFLENWSRYRSGMPLQNLVDKQAGY